MTDTLHRFGQLKTQMAMSDHRLTRIVILGGGTAGWMTAAALAQTLKNSVAITLIESDEIATIGVGEATIPTIHWFNQLIGFDEAEFLRETKASFKLGIEFVNWARPKHRYMHPFGRYGAPLNGVSIHHLWRKANPLGTMAEFQRYSLATAAALANKFARPNNEPQSILSTLGYAYHFDASLYARYLRRLAEGQGALRVEGKVAEVRQNTATGFVEALVTERGEEFAGDVFIDCSGMRALLIGEALGVPYDDWSHWLPCDRALAVPSTRTGPLTPYTRSTAHSAGWQWRIPLQHRTGNGHVYSSAFIGDDAARKVLLDHIDGEALAEPRLISFRTGKRREMWAKNVVAIGLSSGFLEPLESTSIHLIQSGIAKFISLLPDRDCDPNLARQFNLLFERDMENIRDFLVLHYHSTSGKDDALWAHCRNMTLPDSLLYKEAHFRRSGRIMIQPEDLFQEASWLAVFMGQGILPQDYNPLADLIAPDVINQHLRQVKDVIERAAMSFPTHDQALEAALQARRQRPAR